MTSRTPKEATVEHTPDIRRIGNAIAVRDTKCTRCEAPIAKGERCSVFRERATSSAEARNAGTMYPKRRWCMVCARGAAVLESM